MSPSAPQDRERTGKVPRRPAPGRVQGARVHPRGAPTHAREKGVLTHTFISLAASYTPTVRRS